MINEIKLETFNSILKKERKENIIGKSTKKFEKKIDEIKNKNIRESLSQLLKVIKNG